MLNKNWRSFEEAREWAMASGMNTQKDWLSTDLPSDIPKSPYFVYKGEWAGWKDFLGKKWMTFEEACEWAMASGIKTKKDWSAAELPSNMPKSPDTLYKGEWAGWSSFFKKWFSFDEAREWARASGIGFEVNARKAWGKAELPVGVPRCPYYVYGTEWTNWYDWFGMSRQRPLANKWFTFEEAREWAMANGIRTQKDWLSTDLPVGMPRSPQSVYKDKWASWKDFLGDKWLSFDEAREWARASGIRTWIEWQSAELSVGVPRSPQSVYKDKWVGWKNFFKKGKKRRIPKSNK